MKLSRKTTIELTASEANIVGHTSYAAYKFWNDLSYERLHYSALGLESMHQKMHSWPFRRIIDKLKYRLQKEGITLLMEKKSYSSQCSPLSKGVGRDYREKSKRVKRGLFVDGDRRWDADAVGAYNILSLYRERMGILIQMADIAMPYVYKVAV